MIIKNVFISQVYRKLTIYTALTHRRTGIKADKPFASHLMMNQNKASEINAPAPIVNRLLNNTRICRIIPSPSGINITVIYLPATVKKAGMMTKGVKNPKG